MGVLGQPRSYHKKFKYLVECQGLHGIREGVAGFRTCSELSVEAAKVEYSEGGTLIPNKSPGRLTYSDVTLERGATQDKDLFLWFKDVANAAANSGLVEPDFRRILDIVQQERDNSTLRRWRLFGAWPQKFVAGDWDNEADDNVIESVTLTYDWFDLVQRA
jgi:phage tail-like protein